MEINNQVFEIIEEITDISKEEYDVADSLMEDLSLSSLEIVTLISSVEKKFKIRITSSELNEIISVEDLCETVKKKLVN